MPNSYDIRGAQEPVSSGLYRLQYTHVITRITWYSEHAYTKEKAEKLKERLASQMPEVEIVLVLDTNQK